MACRMARPAKRIPLPFQVSADLRKAFQIGLPRSQRGPALPTRPAISSMRHARRYQRTSDSISSLTPVPPNSRSGTCPWRFAAARLVLAEKQHEPMIRFLSRAITRDPTPCTPGRRTPSRSRPAARSRSPSAPALPSAPLRRRPAAAAGPEKWQEVDRVKPHRAPNRLPRSLTQDHLRFIGPRSWGPQLV